MGSSWEILKDLIRFFRIKEVPDIDVGRAKLSEFRDNYRFPSHVSESSFCWVAPRNLHQKTTGDGDLRVVRATVGFQKRARLVKRRIDGEIDAVLCVKISDWP
jgi:hypothetical protein